MRIGSWVLFTVSRNSLYWGSLNQGFSVPLQFIPIYFTAQITRANRKRIENRKFDISSAKCMYEIKPFDQCYDPRVSSNYYSMPNKCVFLKTKN